MNLAMDLVDQVNKLPEIKDVTILVTGGARPNPGHGACAAVVKGRPEVYLSAYIGEDVSNNAADFAALNLGLTLAIGLGADNASIISDSGFAIDYLNGLADRPVPEVLRDLATHYHETLDLQNFNSYGIEFGDEYDVSEAKAIVKEVIAAKPFLHPKKTPNQRIISEVLPVLTDFDVVVTGMSMPVMHTSLFPIVPLPYYSMYGPMAKPSIEIDVWDKIKDVPDAILVWKPYGKRELPFFTNQLGVKLHAEVQDTPEGAELVCTEVADAYLGIPVTGRLGRLGKPLYYLEAPEWWSFEKTLAFYNDDAGR